MFRSMLRQLKKNWTTTPRRPARAPTRRATLAVEGLEDRTVPSTLNVDTVGNATYTAFAGISDNLTLSQRLVHFQFGLTFLESTLTDTAQKIFVTGPGASRWFGSGTNQVSTLFPVKSLSATFQNGNDIIDIQKINYTTALVTRSATVTVQADSAPLTIDAAGALQVFAGQASSGVTAITGPVTLANSVAHGTDLFISDLGDPTNRTISVSDTAVNFKGLASFNYQPNEMSLLTVRGASVFPSNLWTVLNTPGGATTVLTMDQDPVFVQATTGRLILQGPSAVFIGQGGSVQGIKGEVDVQAVDAVVNVDDSADPVGRNAIVGATSLIGLAPAPITYPLFQGGFKVKGGTGNNVFTVTSTPVVKTVLANVLDLGTGSDKVTVLGDTTPLFIIAQSGNDTINEGGGRTANILAFVSIQNAKGQDHLIVDDSKDPTFRTVTLETGTITGLTPPGVTIFTFGATDLTVDGGPGGDMFNVLDTLGNIPVTINGGSSKGSSALNGPNLTNVWNVTGLNAGQVRNVAFKNIGVLGGGKVSDVFRFSNGAGVTGDVLDFSPGGIETLDYSAYTTPVIVDLKTFTALAGGIQTSVFNITNVFGGQGNNVLVGDANTALLQGGSGRDLLFSGGGNTKLRAGSGEAVLVGGHYIFDTDLNALEHLRAEWSRTDEGTAADPTGYLARVNHLENGGGKNDPFLLNTTTVFADGGTQTLISGAGLDFYLFDKSDVVNPPPRPGEKTLLVK
jgi:hypothetical protein